MFGRMECPVGKLIVSPYAAVMRLRRWAYRRGLLARDRAAVPVICVGNLTTGGTGKTPMVVWVVRTLEGLGRRPAVLTRGYKAVRGASDEAELLRHLTGANVVVNPDRVAGAATAVANGADVLVMDDGFQHLHLCRDLDIVLIDATNPFGGGCCLPVGRSREPLSALRDAGAIVLTRTDVAAEAQVEKLRRRLERLAPQASLHAAVHAPVKIIDHEGRPQAPQCLAGRKVFAFCGIGNPRGFLATVEGLGASLVGHLNLRDHVRYKPILLETVCRLADARGADVLLTTQKDGVKLAAFSIDRPIWQLAIEIEITEGRRELEERIGRVVAGKGEG